MRVSRAMVRPTQLVQMLALVCACSPPAPRRPDPPLPTDVAVLPLFDPAAAVADGPPVGLVGAPLAVLDFAPQGRVDADYLESLQFRFNQAVVGRDLAGPDPTALLIIDPPLPGRATWEAPDELYFTPSEPPRPGIRYSVRLSSELRGADGRPLADARTWTFETELRAISTTHPSLDEEHPIDAPVILHTDASVTAAGLAAHLAARVYPLPAIRRDPWDSLLAEHVPRARATAGAKLPVTVRAASKRDLIAAGDAFSDPEPGVFAVRPASRWPAAREIELVVRPGLTGSAGPVATDAAWATSFYTLRPQALESITCTRAAPCGRDAPLLRFRNVVPTAQFSGVTVSPRPDGFAVEHHDERGRVLSLSGAFRPGTVYTVKLGPGFKDWSGQSLPTTTRELVFRDVADIRLPSATGIVSPDDPQIGVETHQLRSVRVKVGVFDERELAGVYDLDDRRDLAGLVFPARAHTQVIALQPQGDTRWASTRLDLAALTAAIRPANTPLRGVVLVEVAADQLVAPGRDAAAAPRPARGLYRVTDLMLVAHTSRAATVVRATHLSSGTPAAGVAVCFLGPATAGTACRSLGTTDRDGLVRAVVPLPHNIPSTYLRNSRNYHGDDREYEYDEYEYDDDDPPRARRPPERVRLVARDPSTGDAAYLNLGPAPVDRPYGRFGRRSDIPGLRPGELLLTRLVRDRGAYRPGERVHLVGWAARDTPYERHNLAPLVLGTEVELALIDPTGKTVAREAARTIAGSKFSATLTLPEDAALGPYKAVATLHHQDTEAAFHVQDFRTPEFSLTATPRSPDIVGGEIAVVDLRADYYFGAAVPLTDATWEPDCRPMRYSPPNLEPGWTVGLADIPDGDTEDSDDRKKIPAAPGDPTGRRTLRARLAVKAPLVPHRCTLTVFAQDASAQGVGADPIVTVHPASLYLAVRPPEFAYGGDRVAVPLRALTRDGERAAASAVRLDVVRSWDEPIFKEEDGVRWQSGTKRRQTTLPSCTVDLAARGRDATCEIFTEHTGTYALTATATVDGREVRTTTSFMVWARPARTTAARADEAPAQELELTASKTEVRPGDRIDVQIRGPWPGARGLLVSVRRGVRDVHPFVLTDGRASLSLTADDSWTPSIYLGAHVIAPGSAKHPPHACADYLQISQDPAHRRLRVAIDAPREAGPGDRFDVTVGVRDHEDRPVAGHVAVWAVDEAVLTLTDEQLPDLLPAFLPSDHGEADTYEDYADILLSFVPATSDPGWPGRARSYARKLKGDAAGDGSGEHSPRIARSRPRLRFETTPLFLADAAVDESGLTRVPVTLPDNLTTFRLTAIASADLAAAAAPGRFGGGEARVVVTAPLTVRAAAPRQLRPGDTAELAALVDNRTDRPGRVVVTADLRDAHGPGGPALELLSESSGSREIAAHGQARVAFQVRAHASADAALELRARFTPTGGLRSRRDAVRVDLPVEAEPTQVDHVSIHGEVSSDQAVQLPIQLPRGALAGHGGLELTTSATLVGGLDQAARALIDYPYGCAEQTASRLLPLIALRGQSLAVPPEFLTATLGRLASMQTDRGGFAYWPGDPEVNVYASAYATWMLQRAASAGLPVPRDMLHHALGDLARRVESQDLAHAGAGVTAELGAPLALALHALADAGERSEEIDAATAALYARRGALPLFVRALLLLALHRRDPNSEQVATLVDELQARVRRDPTGAHVDELLPYAMDAYFHSDTRSDALVLLALLQARPDLPVVAELVRGLQARRPGGAWRNTQENAYAILALAEWARLREPADPDMQARVWLADRNVLDVPLRRRDATPTVRAPMVDLIALTQRTDGVLPLVIHRQGTGTLFYRLGVEWAAAGDQPARDQGIAVTRTLRVAAGGSLDRVALGDPVAVDLELRNFQRLRYVALDVPIPAGLEAVQQDLGKGQSAATLTGADGQWFDRQELRRDRVLVFIDDLPPGRHNHTIHLRATSRGRYALPPAHAEAMYIPEIYGRSSGAKLEVR